MNKPFTRGQKARNMGNSRDNAVEQAVDAPPMPHVIIEEDVLRRFIAALRLSYWVRAAKEHDQGGRP